MTKPVARVGDTSTGHAPAFPPTSSLSGSPTFFVNNKPVLRVGDPWATHQLPFPPVVPHDPVCSQGAPTFFIEGRAVSRVGDVLSCSDVIAAGSPDFFIGD